MFVTRPPVNCSCCSPDIAWDTPTPRNATAEPVALLSPEQVSAAVPWRWLSWRCWLAESGWAVPSQSLCVTQSSCHVCVRKCSSSAAPGPRRRKGIIRCLPRHEQTLTLVSSQSWPGQGSEAGAGGEVFLGVALQHLLF